MGDDAGLPRRRQRGRGAYTAVADTDVLRLVEDAAPHLVPPDQTDARRTAPERSDVRRYVRGTPEMEAFPRNGHDRHRRLRRDPVDLPHDEMIEHQVADHEQPDAREPPDDAREVVNLRPRHDDVSAATARAVP